MSSLSQRFIAAAASSVPQVSSGRLVVCSNGQAAGYRMLNRILNNSSWRQTVRDSLYFEKPTDKRKRLCRERSEAVFKQQVSRRVLLANKMLKMGY